MSETEFDIGYKIGVKESKGCIKELEKLLAEKDKQIDEARRYLDGIKFSGRKCGDGDCSIFLHWDNINKLKDILKQFKESE